MTARSWRLLTRRSEGFLLERDWSLPIESWPQEDFVQVARGAHRHVVEFIAQNDRIYALKELPGEAAMNEYRLLRRMAEDGLPVVDVLGVVQRDHLDDVLITRYLDFSLPYRHLFASRFGPLRAAEDVAQRLLDSLSLLLVRLHLGGYYWGDCSLNNTLLRRDAGALAAYLVDVETGEHHEQLTDGQREADLEITELNVAGGLMDVEAELGLSIGLDPVETAEQVRNRYERLWAELTEPLVFAEHERFRIDERIRRLNDLGFHVDEVAVETVAGGPDPLLRLSTCVTEQGFHRRRLLDLTGLHAEENQARTVLNDLNAFRSHMEALEGRAMPRSVAAYRWLAEVFEPVVEQIPADMRDRLAPVELFVEVQRHKWHMSQQAGHDVGLQVATEAYLADILPEAPTEKVLTAGDAVAEDDLRGYG